MGETSSQRYEALIQFLYQAPIGLVQTTLDGEILMINPMSAQLLMPLAVDGTFVNLFDVLRPLAPQLRELANQPAKPGEVIYEATHTVTVPSSRQVRSQSPVVMVRRRSCRAQTLSLRLLRLDETTLMASVNDVTLFVQQEQQRQAGQLRDALRVDRLTLMPNRAVMVEHIGRALERVAASGSRPFAVLFINVDRFDRINVTLGQSAGDRLIQLMASRIQSTLREDDVFTAGRLGGDEFVIVLEVHESITEVLTVAQRLTLELCTAAYTIGELRVHLGISMGVLTSAEATGDADAALQDANLAMREAKRAGGSRFCVFEPGMRERANRRAVLENELQFALSDDQLFVVYQPIMDLKSGDVTGVEALVRWRHPEHGLMSPLEFIPIAEETGLIGRLGELVLGTACCQLVAWQQTFGVQAPRIMSVNLSRAQLLDSRIVAKVRSALDSSGLAAACLQLEITESLAAQDEQIQLRLQELKTLGLTLALDDFGTGYSSLASLHQLPIDVIKIDRSFVSQLTSSAHHQVLIEATIRVAQSLGLHTVAEGIETESQSATLTTLECEKGQGYLYSRPLPQKEATQWLAAHAQTCEICNSLARRCACPSQA